MNANHYKVKEKLSEEFEWLKKNFPLNSFQNIELFVYKAEDYNRKFEKEHHDTYEQKEIDGFLMETISEGDIEHAIFLIISENHVPDEVDEMILAKGDIKKEHLFYFMLYHEYGHLTHLHESYLKNGIEAYLDEKEEMEEALDALILLKDKEEISEETFHIYYRELWFEKWADDFAYDIYSKRKETLE